MTDHELTSNMQPHLAKLRALEGPTVTTERSWDADGFEPGFYASANEDLLHSIKTLCERYRRDFDLSRKRKQLALLRSGNKAAADALIKNCFHNPSLDSVLVVVGNDDSDTMALTSPRDADVRKLFNNPRIIPFGHSYPDLEPEFREAPATVFSMTANHSSSWRYRNLKLSLRSYNPVELYLTDNPYTYFPMCFVNCSDEHIHQVYTEITDIMYFARRPADYSAQTFISFCREPITFYEIDWKLKVRHHFLRVRVTDEIFLSFRKEYLRTNSMALINDNHAMNEVDLILLEESSEEEESEEEGSEEVTSEEGSDEVSIEGSEEISEEESVYSEEEVEDDESALVSVTSPVESAFESIDDSLMSDSLYDGDSSIRVGESASVALEQDETEEDEDGDSEEVDTDIHSEEYEEVDLEESDSIVGEDEEVVSVALEETNTEEASIWPSDIDSLEYDRIVAQSPPPPYSKDSGAPVVPLVV